MRSANASASRGHPFGESSADFKGHVAAHRQPPEHHPLDAVAIEQRPRVVGEIAHAVRGWRRVAGAVSAQGEALHKLPPTVARFRIGVDETNGIKS